jgi:hypothetical protein
MNPTSPLESIQLPKKRTQTNSERTGKTCCKHAKMPKRSERARSKRQVQEDGNFPLQGGAIALAPRRDGNDRGVCKHGCPNYQITSALRAAPPPQPAESLRLSGQSRTLAPPPRRLEGCAFRPARRRLFRQGVLRKGQAFPQIRRRSRFEMLPFGDFDATLRGQSPSLTLSCPYGIILHLMLRD